MAVTTTITEKVQYTDVDSHLSNCIGGTGEDYRMLEPNTKDIYGGILAIRGWYGDNLSSCCMLKSISIHLEGVCENTNFKCDCDFATMVLTTNDDLSKNTKFTVGSYSKEGTFSKTFKSGSWQSVDNTVAVTKYNGGSVPANTVFPGVKLVFWNGNRLTTVKCKIRNVTISATRTRACWVIFEGDGITKTKTMYDHGAVPSYGSTPTRVGYDFVGWKSGGTTYTGALPAAGEQDVTYTAVWEIAYVIMHYIGNGATSGEDARIGQQRDISCTLKSISNWLEKKYAVQLHHNDGNDTSETLYSSAEFLGWYTAAKDGERVGGSGDSYTPTNHIDLYAHWSEMSAVTLETITRKGYTFLGWYTAAEGGTKVGDGGDSYTPTENAVHLYAQWSSNAINQFRIGSKSPEFYLGQTPVFKIFKGATEIYYNPFVKDTLVSLPYGSKIKFGSYPTTEEKLVWFIVDKGHTGYPLGSVTLMAKQPVAALCFDNDEPNNDNVKAQRGGNPRYSLSNISQWLNAQELQGWFVKQHEADAEPDYASQAGFLSCFHPQEISSILNTTLNIPVPDFETGNFLTCDVVETKVFIPSSTEVGYPSYGDKFNGKTTSSIFRHLPYDDIPSNYCWTRTARGQSSNLFLYSQRSNDAQSADTSHGIQPIINLPGFLDVSENPDSDGCYTVIF